VTAIPGAAIQGGGGTVRWQGWLPRFTPSDFRLRSIVGELKGASLADWPDYV
jgi:hypothetical protein